MVYAFLNAEVGSVSARPEIGIMSPKKRVWEEDAVKPRPSGGAPHATVRMMSLRKRIREEIAIMEEFSYIEELDC